MFLADLVLVVSGWTSSIDRDAELSVHHLLGTGSYGFFKVVAFLGDPGTRVIEAGAIVFLVAVWRRWSDATFILLAAGGGALLTTIVKDIVRRPRPRLFHRPVGVSGFSFPSGHSDAVVVFVLIGVYFASRATQNHTARIAVAVTGAAFAVLVGLSRIVLGVHYPTDVIGGYTLGASWTAGTTVLLTRLPNRDPQTRGTDPRSR